jgi:dihydropteroate synthase type 2
VVNLSEDSFSAGGRHPDADAAIAHALRLVRDGADAIDVGAAASNPRARTVEPAEEIARLEPVVTALQREGVPVSVDSFAPAVQQWALTCHVDFLNDTRGFPDSALYHQFASTPSRLIVMHAIQDTGRADRSQGNASTVLDHVVSFFDERLAAFEAAGIDRERCILDPGMGLFLGTGAEPSIVILRALGELRARYGLPVLVGVSRKSVVGLLSGRPVEERGAATLAAELYAVRQGADWIRTHDVRALRDGLAVQGALEGR